MTPEEAADYLRVKQSWLADHTANGDIASMKIGRFRRYRRKDLDAYLESRLEGGKAWTR